MTPFPGGVIIAGRRSKESGARSKELGTGDLKTGELGRAYSRGRSDIGGGGSVRAGGDSAGGEAGSKSAGGGGVDGAISAGWSRLAGSRRPIGSPSSSPIQDPIKAPKLTSVIRKPIHLSLELAQKPIETRKMIKLPRIRPARRGLKREPSPRMAAAKTAALIAESMSVTLRL